MSNLLIEPDGALSFRRPFTQVVKENLKLTNQGAAPLAFKVKTTSPKQYCVRPNAAVVLPGETKEVQVLLQPMKDREEQEPFDYKCKDKFLIQWIPITNEEKDHDVTEMWATSANQKDVQEHKLKCVFLPPAGGESAGTAAAADVAITPATSHVSFQSVGEEKPAKASTDPVVEKPTPEVTTSSKKLEQLLQEAYEKNKLLVQENTQLKRQTQLRQRTDGVSSSISGNPVVPPPVTKTTVKAKPTLDIKFLLLVSVISLVLGFQLAKFLSF